MPKRKPLDYKAQFVPGVFRPQEEVESALETLTAGEELEAPAAVTQPAPHRARPPVRTNERPVERAPQQRMNIRHSFDVWQDQLHALADIQARDFAVSGKKPKMGDFVKEALDEYISRKRREYERTVERTNGQRGGEANDVA